MARRSFVDTVYDVMEMLRDGPVTAAEIAEKTGINHQTVRRLIADLQRRAAKRGVDLTDGETPTASGRPAVTYRMTADDLKKLFP